MPAPHRAVPPPRPTAPTEPDAPPAAGPIYRGLGKALLGFLPGFALVDAFVGWWDRGQGPQEKGNWIADERLGWRPKPHFENPEFDTRLDRWGMRNDAIPPGADPAEVRLLALGASRAYGAAGALQGEIWSYELERRLAGAELPADVRVLNAAVMGYSAVQACRRGIALLDEVEPDLVLLFLSPRAQVLLDPSVTRHWVRVGTRLVQEDVIEGWPEVLHPAVAAAHGLLSHSNLYRRKRARFAITDEDRDADIQRWVLSKRSEERDVRDMLERTWDELAALAELTDERGIELRVLILAEQFMDSDERWRDYCMQNAVEGAPPLGTPRHEPLEVLAERLDALGLRHWDLIAEIEEIGARKRHYLNDDQGHWSGAGHAVVAAGLERRLREEGLLEELARRRAERPRR